MKTMLKPLSRAYCALVIPVLSFAIAIFLAGLPKGAFAESGSADESPSISDRPVVRVTVTEAGVNFFKADVRVLADGADNTGKVSIFGDWWKDGAESMPHEITKGVAVGETYKLLATGLEPGATYVYSISAINSENAVGAPSAGTFETASNVIVGGTYSTMTVTGYTGTTELGDFPVLVRLAAGSPSGFDYTKCPDGSTLRFVDGDGNVLCHEIDTWNAAGESLVWVKVPTLSGADTSFRMYFGPGPYAAVTVDTAATWSKYAAVIHGGETITGNTDGDGQTIAAGDVHDSSPNALDVKVFNAKSISTIEAGYLGRGFNRSSNNNDNLGLALESPRKNGKLADKNTFTVSGWYRYTGGNATKTLGGDGLGWGNNTFFWLYEGGSYLSFATSVGHHGANVGWNWVKDEWTHFEVSYAAGPYRQYKNGVFMQGGDAGNLSESTEDYISFGALRSTAASTGNDNINGLVGDMDELRVYDGAASDDWVAAEVATMTNANFVTAAAAVEVASGEYGDEIVAEFGKLSQRDNGITIPYDVKWPGAGCETARVALEYGADSEHLDGSVDLVEGAVGKGEAFFDDFEFDRAYSCRLVVVNDEGADTYSEVYTFTTPEEKFGASVSPQNTATLSTFTDTDDLATPGNILRDRTGTWVSGNHSGEITGLTNGKAKWQNDDIRIGDGTTVAMWEFDGPQNLSAVNFYASWGDWRANIIVNGIEVRDLDGQWTTLAGSKFNQGPNGTRNRVNFAPADPDDVLAANVDAIRISFNGPGDGWRDYQEIEVIAYDGVIGRMEASDVVYDGAALRAKLTRAKPRGEASLFACYGDTYGGADTSAWEHVVAVGVIPAGETNATVAAEIGTARYVRFHSPEAGMTPTVFVTHLPVADGTAAVLGVPRTVSTNVTAATVVANVLSRGHDVASYDLRVVYEHGTDRTYVYTNLVVSGASEIGERAVDLTGLKPGTAYTVKFLADNGNCIVESEAATFTTVEEEYPWPYTPPDGGILLDYIESTGEQRIFTGVSAVKGQTVIDIHFSPKASGGTLFTNGGWDWNTYLFWLDGSLNFGNGCATDTLVANADYRVVISNGWSTIWRDGVMRANNKSEPNAGSNGISLFADSGNNNRAKYRFYSMKMWVAGELRLDLVPALDAEGVACLYDYVSGEYLYDTRKVAPFTQGNQLPPPPRLAFGTTCVDGAEIVAVVTRPAEYAAAVADVRVSRDGGELGPVIGAFAAGETTTTVRIPFAAGENMYRIAANLVAEDGFTRTGEGRVRPQWWGWSGGVGAHGGDLNHPG